MSGHMSVREEGTGHLSQLCDSWDAHSTPQGEVTECTQRRDPLSYRDCCRQGGVDRDMSQPPDI